MDNRLYPLPGEIAKKIINQSETVGEAIRLTSKKSICSFIDKGVPDYQRDLIVKSVKNSVLDRLYKIKSK